MERIAVDSCTVLLGPEGLSAPVVYVIDAPEHPFDLSKVASGRTCTLVSVPVSCWGDTLTPWPAPALYRDEPDYGGGAQDTLEQLCREVIPSVEAAHGLAPSQRALCGYSLGGLFSLYAFTHGDAFRACACLSGSVWYEGWVDHLRTLELDLAGRFAYLSVGTKEKHGPRPIMRTVQANMEICAEILRSRGCVVEYRTGPGNHMSFIPERYAAGIGALEDFLTRS